MYSIFDEEYARVQPGVEPSEEFLKLRFGFSGNYSNRIILNLVKEGFITITITVFSINRALILQYLELVDKKVRMPVLVDNITEIPGSVIKNNGPNSTKKVPHPVLTKNDTSIPRSVIKGKGPGLTKNSKPTPCVLVIQSEISPSEGVEEEVAVAGPSTNVATSISSSSREGSPEGCLVDLNKTLEDKNGFSFHTKFTWPTRFTNRESRKQGEKIDPDSVASFGKRSSKPLFGQITDIRAPKQNNGDNINWNLHFIIGKDGEMIQAWVFGPEDQVKSFTEKISQDDYFVFWGDYSVKEKCF